MSKISIHEDITKANTLPSKFYNFNDYFKLTINNIFTRSWQFINHKDYIRHNLYPFTFLKGLINEPYILILDKNVKVFSNVCTHRANVLCLNKVNAKSIQCKYHGRTFSLSGKLNKAPGFEDVKNFPTNKDNLKEVPSKLWNKFIFSSIKSPFRIDEVFNDISSRLSSYPFENLIFNNKKSNTYIIDAHWALYCENYLEGFHVPFIHKGLNNDVDFSSYKIELLNHGVLQYVKYKSGSNLDQIFENNIYAYYYWIFPNMMFNFYNWGLSINIIEPLENNKTRIKFLSFPIKEKTQPNDSSSGLDVIEKEDQNIVLNVQKGIKSYHYDSGRYAAKHEKGVHYFHQLISKYLD